MIPGAIAKELTPDNLETLKDFLADQFGLTEDNDFQGIIPLLIAAYGSGIPQGIYQFFHDLHVLERQIQNYLAALGSDITSAEKSLTTGLPLTIGLTGGTL